MKKLLSILMISLTAVILSSCIIVAHEEPKYKFYFVNDTLSPVYDWYLKDEDGDNHAKSSGYCEIPPGAYSYKSGLSEDYYQLWFCPLQTIASDYYVHTDYIKLDEDTTYYLNLDRFYDGKPNNRSAVNEETVSESGTLVLTDSKGNIYPLYKAEE